MSRRCLAYPTSPSVSTCTPHRRFILISIVSSMKNLIPVHFTFYTSSSTSATTSPASEESKKEESEPICPSCKKHLSNSSLLFRACPTLPLTSNRKSDSYWQTVCKPCGHVTCKTCADTLVRPSKQCIVCDVKAKDIIELKREGMPLRLLKLTPTHPKNVGTGFAGGGLAETSKSGIAFQG